MKVKVEHIGLWTKDIEAMKDFYCKYFEASSTDLYHNTKTGFYSYFLTFESGARLELMHREDITESHPDSLGFAHLAFSLGSKDAVDEFAYYMQSQGFPIQNGPRTTGDGYYEAVIHDLEGNILELTI
ncbi:glyoxalase [Streptococcus bovimastitidis]|uniref:Glyoxalase n=1 Tax=Streptococcus bovimastitidis TaxID=1856638 RepID=A0A1L8MPW3_9STRE|nr:VOC family protein [Streptococcus bovimastitidis]OJF72772.1 glyoxalase [Streptococcus bovimastitidis]